MLKQLWFEKEQGDAKIALPVYGFADTLKLRPRDRILRCIFPDSPSIRAIADNQNFSLIKERPLTRLLEATLNGSAKGILCLPGGTASFIVKAQTRSDRPIVFIPSNRGVGQGVELIEPDEDFSAHRQVRILNRGIVEGSRDMCDRQIKVRLTIWFPNVVDRKLPVEPLPPKCINLHAIGAPDSDPERNQILSVFGCYTDDAEYCKSPHEGIQLTMRYKSIMNEDL